MHLFLAWRAMEDRISNIGYKLESFLYGDSRARHTFLLACTDEHPLVLIEVDLGDTKKLIHKSMKLNIVELDDIPSYICQIELIGNTTSPTAFDDMVTAANKFMKDNPHYNVYSNNCRTFVEYIIDQIPEFRERIPRKNGSILEYYHSRAIEEHPGALVKSKQILKEIHELHQRNREYKYAGKLVLNIQLPQFDSDTAPEITNLRL